MLNYGCDPEVFCFAEVEGEITVISPALLMTKNKIKPVINDPKHPIFIDKENYRWHMDGVAFELTIKKPQNNYRDIYKIMADSISDLRDLIYSVNYEGLNLGLEITPTIKINQSLYDLNDPLVYQGFIFGCDPDQDALIPDYNCKTVNVFSHPYRYGGGHIHISGNNLLWENYKMAISLLACTVGCFCIAKSEKPEEERKRVLTYGRPGRYRLQNYPNGDKGIEYRTPSNSWIRLSRDEYNNLFYLIDLAVNKFLVNEKLSQKIVRAYLESAIYAITEADKTLAERIYSEIINCY